MEYREATDQETRDYLAGYASIPGARETEHGLMVPVTTRTAEHVVLIGGAL